MPTCDGVIASLTCAPLRSGDLGGISANDRRLPVFVFHVMSTGMGAGYYGPDAAHAYRCAARWGLVCVDDQLIGLSSGRFFVAR